MISSLCSSLEIFSVRPSTFYDPRLLTFFILLTDHQMEAFPVTTRGMMVYFISLWCESFPLFTSLGRKANKSFLPVLLYPLLFTFPGIQQKDMNICIWFFVGSFHRSSFCTSNNSCKLSANHWELLTYCKYFMIVTVSKKSNE